MQQMLSSTSSSSEHRKFMNDKEGKSSTSPGHFFNQQTNPEHNHLFRKYNEFINGQNSIISEVLLETKAKCIPSHMEEEVANKLRDSSNQFIKNLLNQLTEAYSKLRVLKSSSDEKVAQLQCELSQEKCASKLLRNQFYSSWEENSEQCDKYLQFMQKELKQTVQQYETKILDFLKQIQKKEQFCDRIYCQKLELNNQLTQLNRVLRMERQSMNQKCKQFKGMKMLVGEYQTAIKDLEIEKQSLENRISELSEKVKQLQQYQKDLIGELDGCGFKNSQKDSEIKTVSKMLEQAKLMNIRYCQELEHLKIKAKQDSIVQENNLILLKNNQTSLKLEIERAELKITTSSKQMNDLRQQLANSYEEIRKSKREAKKIIAKVELMFKSKQKLVKKACKLKLNELRTQNQELKQSISRQIFKFYQQLKIDLLTSSVPESKSLFFSSQLVRA